MAVGIDLDGKVAVVTGAGRGIGLAVAERLAEAGAHGVIFDKTVTEHDTTYAVDVSDEESVARAFRDVVNRFGRLDILVNCAGITADEWLLDMTVEQFDQVVAVNQRGTFLCMREAGRIMIRSDMEAGFMGAIVNISSISAAGNRMQANYAASKAAVETMTNTAAQEWGRYNVRVNAIAPGPVDTLMLADLDENARKGYLKRTPMKKLGQPVDIANAALFLASPLASHISGSVLIVSGGLHFA